MVPTWSHPLSQPQLLSSGAILSAIPHTLRLGKAEVDGSTFHQSSPHPSWSAGQGLTELDSQEKTRRAHDSVRSRDPMRMTPQASLRSRLRIHLPIKTMMLPSHFPFSKGLMIHYSGQQ